MRDRFERRLAEHRLVAILRGVPNDHVEALGHALVDGGIRVLEVALSDPDATNQIRRIRAGLPDEIEVGAGTVVSRELAERAHLAGASFFVTPHVAESVNAYAAEHDLGLICGALTPTEIATARAQGSRFIKLFPASVMGPQYVKALLGPYPDLELIPVGGIGIDNLADYLRAGAVGAGIGSSLTSLDWAAPDFDSALDKARALAEIVSATRA